MYDGSALGNACVVELLMQNDFKLEAPATEVISPIDDSPLLQCGDQCVYQCGYQCVYQCV